MPLDSPPPWQPPPHPRARAAALPPPCLLKVLVVPHPADVLAALPRPLRGRRPPAVQEQLIVVGIPRPGVAAPTRPRLLGGLLQVLSVLSKRGGGREGSGLRGEGGCGQGAWATAARSAGAKGCSAPRRPRASHWGPASRHRGLDPPVPSCPRWPACLPAAAARGGRRRSRLPTCTGWMASPNSSTRFSGRSSAASTCSARRACCWPWPWPRPVPTSPAPCMGTSAGRPSTAAPGQTRASAAAAAPQHANPAQPAVRQRAEAGRARE